MTKKQNRSGVAAILALAVLMTLSAPGAPASEAPASISLLDLDGTTVQLPDLTAGKPTLLVFWATWCGPCRAEIPRINEAFRRFSDDGLAVLAVDPGIRDSLATVRLYAEHYKLSYPVYFDPTQATRAAFDLVGTPTVILLDAGGKEVQRGETVDLKAIEQLMSEWRSKTKIPSDEA